MLQSPQRRNTRYVWSGERNVRGIRMLAAYIPLDEQRYMKRQTRRYPCPQSICIACTEVPVTQYVEQAMAKDV
jgi:hypothetical protein